MEGLYRLDENEKPQSAKAESVETSDDKLTHTFKPHDVIQRRNGDAYAFAQKIRIRSPLQLTVS
jgi:ABC-type oligopeptide transport system substrate-binding subunit